MSSLWPLQVQVSHCHHAHPYSTSLNFISSMSCILLSQFSILHFGGDDTSLRLLSLLSFGSILVVVHFFRSWYAIPLYVVRWPVQSRDRGSIGTILDGSHCCLGGMLLVIDTRNGISNIKTYRHKNTHIHTQKHLRGQSGEFVALG